MYQGSSLSKRRGTYVLQDIPNVAINHRYKSYRLQPPATPPFCYSESSANFFGFLPLLIVFEKITFFRFFFGKKTAQKPIFCKKKKKSTFEIYHYFNSGTQILIPYTILIQFPLFNFKIGLKSSFMVRKTLSKTRHRFQAKGRPVGNLKGPKKIWQR